MIRRIICMDKY